MHSTMYEHNLQILNSSYSPNLVFLSIIIAIIASFTSLTMNERTKNYSFFPKWIWKAMAAISFAFGIWSLHYMGMFAFSLPIIIHYDFLLTIVSVIPPVLTTFILFYYIDKVYLNVKYALLFSVLMTTGVGTMHFIGMASMDSEALHKSNYYIVIAAFLSTTMMFFIFMYFYKKSEKLFARIYLSCLLGIAIAITHYGAMSGMKFYLAIQQTNNTTQSTGRNGELLAFILTLAMIGLIGLLLLASACDRYIEYRAKHYDVLTELPNTKALLRRLQRNNIRQLAVWHFDDYDFIVKTYGYKVTGDFVVELVKKLRTVWHGKNDLYQISHNRFVVIQDWSQNNFLEKLKETQLLFEEPLSYGENVLMIRHFCALSNESINKQSINLLEQALEVLNSTKIMKNGQIIEHKKELHSKEIEKLIKQDVQQAMKNGELFLVYQPKVCLAHRQVIGAEALLRWQHPTLGLLSPTVFIPILEETEQIRIVTDWVIVEVAKQKALWNHLGIDLKSISINIPAAYLTSPHLLEKFQETVRKYGLHAKELELEITETTFVSEMGEAMRAVTVYRELDYGVALDDFGTGLSSLSYLKQMMISTLKIDKSFVGGIPTSIRDCAIIRGMIVLCESLHLQIVIEGVETEEQLNYLQTISDQLIVQGYYFSQPLTSSQFEKWTMEYTLNNNDNVIQQH